MEKIKGLLKRIWNAIIFAFHKLWEKLEPVRKFASPYMKKIAPVVAFLAPVGRVFASAAKAVKGFVIKIGGKVMKIVKPIGVLWMKMVKRIREYEKTPVVFCVVLSLVLYIIVEMFSRRSCIEGITYIFEKPVVFFSNWLIVLATLAVAFLFKKREFFFAIISMLWLGLGVTNYVLLGSRTTPLNFMDFRTAKDVLSIMTVYFSKGEICAIIGAFVLLFVVAVFLFINSPKEKVRPKILASFAAVCIMLMCVTSFSISSGSLATTFKNLQDAYKDYGFAYCFACSVVDRGIEKPSGYSEESVQAILDKIEAAGGEGVDVEYVKAEKPSKENPNVIMLQMESFFDVNYVKGTTYSQEPLPVFNWLKDNYTSGWLVQPSFGAGTVNVEYEILTGQPMTNFGPGEYPYTTVLRQETDESIAFDLKEYGYGTHAVHNHTGKFYGRYLVYPHLGFDSFTSVEYMQDVERNPLNWADDSILTGEIVKCMDSTETPDFVYAVSVQGHGKYPLEVIDETQTITVQGFNPAEAVGFEYFTNQIYRMDAFLGELITELEAKQEPTVLCIYGDHLPKFDFEADDLENGNLYETEYVIWDNIGLEEADRDLSAYQLYPYIMELIDKHAGVITQFHQYCSDDPIFFADLHTLQYDMLYGKNYVYGGTEHFVKTNMKMGIDPISVTDIRKVGKFLYVEGENFTKASKIFINGEEVKTTFYNSGRIMCRKGNSIDAGDKIEIVQMSSKKTHLSTTAQWTWYPDGSVETALDTANLALENVETQEQIEADILAEKASSSVEKPTESNKAA